MIKQKKKKIIRHWSISDKSEHKTLNHKLFILINNEAFRSISASSYDVDTSPTSSDDVDILRKDSLFIRINIINRICWNIY